MSQVVARSSVRWRLGARTRKGVLWFQAGFPAPLEVGDLIFPPIVSPAALLVAFVLAVFKPFGRIRRPDRAGSR